MSEGGDGNKLEVRGPRFAEDATLIQTPTLLVITRARGKASNL